MTCAVRALTAQPAALQTLAGLSCQLDCTEAPGVCSVPTGTGGVQGLCNCSSRSCLRGQHNLLPTKQLIHEAHRLGYLSVTACLLGLSAAVCSVT